MPSSTTQHEQFHFETFEFEPVVPEISASNQTNYLRKFYVELVSALSFAIASECVEFWGKWTDAVSFTLN